MIVDSIVRVSLQSKGEGNNAVRKALVGHAQKKTGTGPFQRLGTAVFSCSGKSASVVGGAIEKLGHALNTYAKEIDFVSITVVGHTG
jgi:hypothetical protein